MLPTFKFDPQATAEEALRFSQKLSQGLATLRQVGDVEFGCTDKDAVYSEDRMVLYRYRGEESPTARIPTLIVYALVNRPYMVDLQEDRSLVRNLLARGEDLYLIDWGYPDRSDRWLTLDDYINGYIHNCVEEICRRHGLPAINVLGICQGGAFSICYTALHPQRVRNLITMVTPVDFHTGDNMLAHWTRHMDVDLFVDTLGNVPADLMNWSYLMLKPYRLNLHKYVGLVDILDDRKALEDFLRMEKWIFDSPDLAGEAYRQFIKDFYQGNKLLNGGLEIGGQAVDPLAITMPVLNIYAEHDHLVPPSASQPLGGIIGSDDYTELAFRGGHIGIYVSGRAQREVPGAIHDWLAQRSG